MQDRTGLTVFLVRVVFVLFETRRFCKVARFVFPDLCDKLYDGKGYGTVFTDANGEAVIDYLKQWDSDEWTDDDIRSEEPRWVNNGTDSVHQKDGYTLIYNSTIGGVYMLYREANDAEIEWYNKLN